MNIKNILPKNPKMVISYSRFSTMKQGGDGSSKSTGNSESRQVELAREFCEEHGYVLDDELSDKGLSGYSEGNLTENASLGKFLTAIKNDKLPKDSILIIESCSRLTRAEPLDALAIFTLIINHGIHIVVLKGLGFERVVNKEEFSRDKSLLWLLCGAVQHSNDHSKDLSDYKLRSYKKQFEAAKEKGNLLTKVIPSWLDIDDMDLMHVCQWKAKIIKGIIKRYLGGKGSVAIARELNAEGVPSITKFKWKNGKRIPIKDSKSNWIPATITTKILYNRALIGEHEAKRYKHDGAKRVVKSYEDKRILKDYYPLIWKTKEQAQKVWASIMAQKALNTKKRGRGTPFNNIFRGMISNGYGHVDGEALTTSQFARGVHIACHTDKDKSGEKRAYRYFISDRAARKVEGWLANSYKVDNLEAEFMQCIDELEWAKICGETSANEERDNVKQDIDVIEEKLATLDNEQQYYLKKIQKALKTGKDVPDAIEQQMDDNQESIDSLNTSHQELKVRHEELSGMELKFNKDDSKLHKLVNENIGNQDIRIALNEEMLDKIDAVTIFGFGWIWCKNTFDMAVDWMPPEFLAMYQDVFGHKPQWSKKVKQLLPAFSAGTYYRQKYRFFEITFKNGAKRVWIGDPQTIEIKGKTYSQYANGYNPIPPLSRLCGYEEHEGPDYERANEWIYNQRAIGYELESLFMFPDKNGDPLKNHKGVTLEALWETLKAKDRQHWKSFNKLKSQHQEEQEIASQVSPLHRYRYLETLEAVFDEEQASEFKELKKQKAVNIYLNKEQEKKQHELVLKDYMQRSDDAKTEEKKDAIYAEWQKVDTAFKVALIKKHEGK